MKIVFRIATLGAIFAFINTSARADVWNWWNIPHVAYGGGYTSYLTVRDPEALASRWISVYLRDDNGALLAANIGGIGASNTDPDSNKAPYYGSSFYFSLAASQETLPWWPCAETALSIHRCRPIPGYRTGT